MIQHEVVSRSEWLDAPEDSLEFTQSWVRHHDRYED